MASRGKPRRHRTAPGMWSEQEVAAASVGTRSVLYKPVVQTPLILPNSMTFRIPLEKGQRFISSDLGLAIQATTELGEPYAPLAGMVGLITKARASINGASFVQQDRVGHRATIQNLVASSPGTYQSRCVLAGAGGYPSMLFPLTDTPAGRNTNAGAAKGTQYGRLLAPIGMPDDNGELLEWEDAAGPFMPGKGSKQNTMGGLVPLRSVFAELAQMPVLPQAGGYLEIAIDFDRTAVVALNHALPLAEVGVHCQLVSTAYILEEKAAAALNAAFAGFSATFYARVMTSNTAAAITAPTVQEMAMGLADENVADILVAAVNTGATATNALTRIFRGNRAASLDISGTTCGFNVAVNGVWKFDSPLVGAERAVALKDALGVRSLYIPPGFGWLTQYTGTADRTGEVSYFNSDIPEAAWAVPNGLLAATRQQLAPFGADLSTFDPTVAARVPASTGRGGIRLQFSRPYTAVATDARCIEAITVYCWANCRRQLSFKTTPGGGLAMDVAAV